MPGDDIKEPPKLDFSNPYYLGSHDVPGAKISHVTLRRDNTVVSDRLSGMSLWILDTGASNHVTGNLMFLEAPRTIASRPVGLPNGQQVASTIMGSVFINESLTLHDVLYVPSLTCNLVSVSQLTATTDYLFVFAKDSCLIQVPSTKTTIGVGELRAGLYWICASAREPVVNSVSTGSASLWHQRLGHPSNKAFKAISFASTLPFSKLSVCETCHFAKQHRNSFALNNKRASAMFELIHCDLWGPYRVVSSCGAKYFLTIVDDFSRATWVYLLIDKTEVTEMFMNFLAMVDKQFSKSVKFVQSDNGNEFNCMAGYFFKNGIHFQTSCVGTPQQNGRVERKHRHILNVGRALLFQANLPKTFWGECILAAAHLINRTPSSLLDNKTPYECLYGTPPSYTNLRVFGCLCFAYNQNTRGDKFEKRGRKCIFVGYPHNKKGWKLYDVDDGSYFVSRDVMFHEDVFPYAVPSASSLNDNNVSLASPFNGPDDMPVSGTVDGPTGQGGQPGPTNEPAVEGQPGPNEPSNSDESSLQGGHTQETSPTGQSDVPGSGDGQPTSEMGDGVDTGIDDMGRGRRQKFPNSRMSGYVLGTARSPSSSRSPSPESSSSGTPYSLANYIDSHSFSPKHRIFLAAITENTEPPSFKEAIRDEKWCVAMKDEIVALERNETWELTTLPADKKALGCRWVYKIKYNSDGSVERFKARLVAFGNHQVEGLDYGETFAPVVKMVTIRAFLSVAAVNNWALHQMDVHNAFLHGDLHEEVYMRLPPGFSRGREGMVCRLKKSLYGLKQAPRCWFAKLATALRNYGFRQSYSDYSLFTFSQDTVRLFVLVYVDDLVIAGNDPFAISAFKSYLGNCFHMKDLGTLKYFLGLEVARSAEGIYLSQRKYALDIISETGLLGAKPAVTPLEQNHQLGLAKGPVLENIESYRRLVGRLVYLAVTRPDLSYAVHILSRFLKEPRQEHFEAALRVVRYLKGSPGQGILLRSDNDLSVSGWCDSDYAGCPLSRKSTTGWFVFLGGSPISWKTKKQSTVSLSSAEAEYRSMAAVVCELKWLKGLLSCLEVPFSLPMKLFCDSQSAIHLAQNPVFHERTKHIEIDCHFVRDAITEGLIAPVHVSTTEQLADIFTKALGVQQFSYLLSKLGILDLHAPA